MKRLTLGPITFCLILAVGCGGSSNQIVTPPPPSISISPTTVNLLVNQTTEFEAKVQGMSSSDVAWSVEEGNGGTVSSGLYRAPWSVGTYHLTAKAVADPTKTATATISVSAVTAFLETLPGGKSTPWSVTPVLGTLHPDGTWGTAPILDPNTNAPMDTSFYDVSVSADGTKLVASSSLLDQQLNVAWNIVKFNADGSGMTSLTNNVPTPSYGDAGGFVKGDRYPQFSPDGQSIVYIHYQHDPLSGQRAGLEVTRMNADGTNPQAVQSTFEYDSFCDFAVQSCPFSENDHRTPSFSSDGSKILFGYFEVLEQQPVFHGVGFANADGTGAETLLTKEVENPPDYYTDFMTEMPVFTGDGSKIAFTRTTLSQNPVSSIYIMNADGSGVAPLYDPGIANTIAVQPRVLADRILFSSNVDNPGTNNFQMYSIMPDGSHLTRLTNNSLYDGFSVPWMNYPAPMGPHPNVAGTWSATWANSSHSGTLSLSQSGSGMLGGTMDVNSSFCYPSGVALTVIGMTNAGMFEGANIFVSSSQGGSGFDIIASVDASNQQMNGSYALNEETVCPDEGSIILTKQ